MASRRSRNACHCHRAPLSSSILFLSWILPHSSFAQLTSAPLPTTLSTTTAPSPTSFTLTSQPTTDPDPDPAATSLSPVDSIGVHAFNYYFLIVAGVALLLCGVILYFGRRRKMKTMLTRRQSQHALARDVESWRNRFRGPGREGEHGRVEGLDERGEAPPPYVPGGKPPSLRSHRSVSEERANGSDAGVAGAVGVTNGDVELRRMSTGASAEPPGYEEASRVVEEDIGDITRPTLAHTTEGRFGSTRRLLSDTRSAS